MTLIQTHEDLNALSSQLSKIIRNEEVIGDAGKPRQPQGTSTINNLAVIANTLSELQASQTLEIGMAYGASTLCFCSVLNRLGKPNAKHIAIDPFQAKHYDNCGLHAVKAEKLDHLLELHYQPSCLILPQLLEKEQKFDLIYIDGSHLFEDAFIDTYFSIRLLREGGIVLIDDSTDSHVSKVISFLRNNLPQGLETLDLSSRRIESSQSLKYRVARKFNKVQLTGFRRIGKLERPYGIALNKF